MQQLLPAMLGWLSQAPDPDLGLLALRRLTEGYKRSSTLARRFRDSPLAAERTCRLLGSSAVLGAAMYRQPEFVDALADDSILATRVDAQRSRRRGARLARLARRRRGPAFRAPAVQAPPAAAHRDARRARVRAARRRGPRAVEPRRRVRGSRAAFTRTPLPFAVIGLGRLGGAELSYASDIDVIFVYDGTTPADFATAERIATRARRRGRRQHRPKGARSASTRACARKATRARSRDRSTATAATSRSGRRRGSSRRSPRRASSPATPRSAQRFIALAHEFVYRDPFPEEWRRDVRRMKARIESERIPPGEDPQFHLKLGRGSLSDIEFTVQLEQLAHGGRATSPCARPRP